MTERYDIAIVGTGFAGSILARVLASLGLQVVLIEKGSHPRFALGESTTPLANLTLERLARRYGLEDLHQLATYGRLQRSLSTLRRGLKRGFTFYQHHRGQPFRNTSANEARLLVAASPDDENADTHWLRQDVDAFLLDRARQAGVSYCDQTTLDRYETGASDGKIRLGGEHQGQRRSWEVDFLIDASGPNGFLGRALGIESQPVGLDSALLYAHFATPESWVELARADGAHFSDGPYPDERAAIHHLFADGWMYVLPFDHGVTSAGIILRRDRPHVELAGLRRDPARAWRELLAPYPTLDRQLATACPVTPFGIADRLQHRLARAAGQRFFLLPHTFAFFDPMFSTGIAWSLIAVERLASLFEGRGAVAPDQAALRYDSLMQREADQLERLLSLAYATLGRFELLTAVSFLYFATVSFSEVEQRLHGIADPWAGFLGASDPQLRGLFAEAQRRLRTIGSKPSSSSEAQAFVAWLHQAIAPRNIAGLADPARRNLYPLDLDVLVSRAELLGMSRGELQAALPRLRGEPVA